MFSIPVLFILMHLLRRLRYDFILRCMHHCKEWMMGLLPYHSHSSLGLVEPSLQPSPLLSRNSLFTGQNELLATTVWKNGVGAVNVFNSLVIKGLDTNLIPVSICSFRLAIFCQALNIAFRNRNCWTLEIR